MSREPTVEPNSAIDGGSAPKKANTASKSIQDVVLLLSKDDNKLSEAQVKTWVDNYKSSLNTEEEAHRERD